MQVNTCKVRLDRATKLLSGLGSEKTRWAQRSEELQSQVENVVGDILLSSGVIAYLGSFTQQFRQARLLRCCCYYYYYYYNNYYYYY